MKIFLYLILTLAFLSLFMSWSDGQTGFDLLVPSSQYSWAFQNELLIGVPHLLLISIIASSLIACIYFVESKRVASLWGAIISLFSLAYLSIIIFIAHSLEGFYFVVEFGNFRWHEVDAGPASMIIMLFILTETFVYIKFKKNRTYRQAATVRNLINILLLFNTGFFGYYFYLFYK